MAVVQLAHRIELTAAKQPGTMAPPWRFVAAIGDRALCLYIQKETLLRCRIILESMRSGLRTYDAGKSDVIIPDHVL